VKWVDWAFDGGSDLAEVPEPSGLCYYPPRDTLFIVDDGAPDRPAGLYEIDLHAKLLQKLELGKDLEGVCYDPVDGMLYVADETGEMVHVVYPDGLKLVGSFQVSREFGGKELLIAGGNGFEGIEFIADPQAARGGYFLLLNQDDPHCLVRVEVPDVQAALPSEPVAITAYWPLPPINSGELYYDQAAGELWVVHSWMNVVQILDIHTMDTLRWEVLPGCAQEGVAFDGQGRLWISSDSGGISRYLPPGTDSQH
jgi:hypothetical protein